MDRVALITGASSGIGYQAALALAREGYHVAATMRNLAARDRLLNAAQQMGVADRLEVYRLDVTDAEAATRVVAAVTDRWGRIDLLVNNAGMAVGGFVEEVDLEAWQEQFAVNVWGLLAVTKAVLPVMRRQKSGRIINISSVAGRFGFPALAPYAASKFAVEGLSEALRLELLPFGIQVVLIEPGAFRTAIWEKGLGRIASDSGSPYADMAARIARQVMRSAQTAPPPDAVVATLLKAARAKRPRLRYVVGSGARRLLWLKALLPWTVVERAALRVLFGRVGRQ
ncbi:oxidoreductase [Calditerricola yamamurae]